ncbi:MAG: PorP/SprF family type IX secretion system membrane protein [Bacteroidia bacterium]
MKKILAIAFGLFTLGSVAQQLPEFSQYINNDFLLNPAIAGTKAYAPATISYRVQWLNFTSAPTTQIGSIHGSFGKNVGVGLSVINAVAGPTSTTSAQFAYAYNFKLGKKTRLSFGLAPMLIQQSLQKNKLTLDEANDNTFNKINGTTLIADVNAGLHLYSDRYFISFSMPQIMENKVRLGDALFTEKLKRHYVLYAGNDFPVKEKYVFTPSILVKAMEYGAPVQYDVNFKATFNQVFFTGLSYRGSTSQSMTETAVAFVGIMKFNFVFGYSYDYAFSSLHSYSAGSHEVFLTYRIGQKKPAPVASSAKIESIPAETPTSKAEQAPTETPAPKVESTPSETSPAKAEQTPAETTTPKVEATPAETPTPKVEASPSETPTPSAEPPKKGK